MTNQKTNQTIVARASHVHSTPRKTKLVIESIIGKNPQVAIDELKFIPNFAAQDVIKLLKQALGNASDQHKLSPDELIIKEAYSTKGRALKRIRFGGRGRVKPYEKITSHLTVVLKTKINKATSIKSTAKSKTTKDTKAKIVKKTSRSKIKKQTK